MSDSLSVAQITSLINGIDPILDNLEQGLQSKIYLERLPIIGSQLRSAFDSGQSALTAFRTLETNIKNACAGVKGLANATVGDLQSAINSAITSAGFNGGVNVSFD